MLLEDLPWSSGQVILSLSVLPKSSIIGRIDLSPLRSNHSVSDCEPLKGRVCFLISIYPGLRKCPASSRWSLCLLNKPASLRARHCARLWGAMTIRELTDPPADPPWKYGTKNLGCAGPMGEQKWGVLDTWGRESEKGDLRGGRQGKMGPELSWWM